MPESTCSVEECEGRVRARGWCDRHWQRWKAHGDPTGSAPVVQNIYSAADLSTGQLAIVSRDGSSLVVHYDLADHPLISSYHWTAHAGGYAQAKPQGAAHIYMHRLVMGVDRSDRREVDHINGDRVDNRRINLRLTDRRLNTQNQAVVNERGTSRYRGVAFYRRTGKWAARVQVDHAACHIGYFSDERAAAEAVAHFRAAQQILSGYPQRHGHTPSAARDA